MADREPLDILVIEDDLDAQANLRDILELVEHHVETAATAAEAMRRSDWSKLDVIILDRRLPDSTADQLLPTLRNLAPDAAVIVVTGYSDLQGAIAALRLGAADYILKPLNPDALLASLDRIAERRRLAREKERSEANFRHLIEAADVMIVILRTDRTILYLSPFAEHLTGYSTQEVKGRDFFELFVPEPERRHALDECGRVLEGRQTHGYQLPNLCRDGTQRWIVWNARLLPDFEGSPALLGVGQDITNLKQAQQRALQAERLAAIGQMMAGLAHESRNALQRSQACLEMLALQVQDQAEALGLINRIQKAQDHLHHLYEDVRGYAAPIHLERSLVNLGDVWREAWSHLENARQDKDATLHEDVGDLDLVCLADRFRMEQVFRNILENALVAGQPPIEIFLRAEQTTLDDRPALRLTIQDNGPGLTPEQKQKLFEPFYTTKTKGTGLGLSIAKRIVEAHGGRLGIGEPQSPSHGAVFLITLPRESQ